MRHRPAGHDLRLGRRSPALINQPLQELSFAASRIREGEFDSRLDENTLTSEIRQVNMGFNRMARELAKVEEDRAVMLAGISHDLRTPLARLRLEAEMSVQDEEAKHNMALDIDQLDAIIDKFMDYARPGDVKLVPVHLSSLVDREMAAFRDPSQIRITSRVAIDTKVMADDTELGRVLQNLFENARRYGRSTDTGIARVNVTYARTGPWVIISVRDHGPGVDPQEARASSPRPSSAATRRAPRPPAPAWAWPSSRRRCSAWAAASRSPTRRTTAAWWRTSVSRRRPDRALVAPAGRVPQTWRRRE